MHCQSVSDIENVSWHRNEKRLEVPLRGSSYVATLKRVNPNCRAACQVAQTRSLSLRVLSEALICPGQGGRGDAVLSRLGGCCFAAFPQRPERSIGRWTGMDMMEGERSKRIPSQASRAYSQ
jgi:hypothetical protein